MRQAEMGDTVKVHYTGSLQDGTVFDSSRDREPMEVTLGSGRLIGGFEDSLVGMSVGDTKSLKILSDDAYGPRREELVICVEKTDFHANLEPREGLSLNLKGPEEQVIQAIITEVSGDSVTMDIIMVGDKPARLLLPRGKSPPRPGIHPGQYYRRRYLGVSREYHESYRRDIGPAGPLVREAISCGRE
jgi:peptidylprolyl isomerase